VISGQRSVVITQWSVVSGRWSVVSAWSVVSGQYPLGKRSGLAVRHLGIQAVRK
jgi:hypothetical protein